MYGIIWCKLVVLFHSFAALLVRTKTLVKRLLVTYKDKIFCNIDKIIVFKIKILSKTLSNLLPEYPAQGRNDICNNNMTTNMKIFFFITH